MFVLNRKAIKILHRILIINRNIFHSLQLLIDCTGTVNIFVNSTKFVMKNAHFIFAIRMINSLMHSRIFIKCWMYFLRLYWNIALVLIVLKIRIYRNTYWFIRTFIYGLSNFLSKWYLTKYTLTSSLLWYSVKWWI